jgi:oxygen-dependent protoporphyrinogen oxidase
MKIDRAPLFTKVFRFDRSNPQPAVGHLDRLATIRTRLAQFPGVHVIGSGYDGVGIPDCVKQAEETAARILRSSRHE